MTEIRMSPQVRAALGADGAKRVAAISLAGAHCAHCGRPLPARGPAAVQVARGPDTLHIGYTHSGCGPSRLVDLPPDVAAVAWPNALDMTMQATLLYTEEGPVPALVAETPTSRTFYTDGPAGGLGELSNVFTTTLLGQGFGLILDLDTTPPRAGGWRIAVHPGTGPLADLEITGRGGLRFYTGTADLTDDWIQAALPARWCLLYVAAEPVAWPVDDNPAAGLAAMHAAAATGGLVAARVPVVWSVA